MNKPNRHHSNNRHQQNNRRGSRGGGSGGRRPHNNNNNNILSKNFDSSGPDMKIRGTASHIADKYIAMARDANVSGDPVRAENFLQHAEHYNRIVMAATAQKEEAAAARARKTSERKENFDSDRKEKDPQTGDSPVAADDNSPEFLTKPVGTKPVRTPRRRTPVRAQKAEGDAGETEEKPARKPVGRPRRRKAVSASPEVAASDDGEQSPVT